MRFFPFTHRRGSLCTSNPQRDSIRCCTHQWIRIKATRHHRYCMNVTKLPQFIYTGEGKPADL